MKIFAPDITGSLNLDGPITASGNISGSVTSTGSFGRVNLATSAFIEKTGSIRHIAVKNIIPHADDLEDFPGNEIKFNSQLTIQGSSNLNLQINDTGGGKIEIDSDGVTAKRRFTVESHVNSQDEYFKVASGSDTLSGTGVSISGSSISTGSFGRVSTTTEIIGAGGVSQTARTNADDLVINNVTTDGVGISILGNDSYFKSINFGGANSNRDAVISYSSTSDNKMTIGTTRASGIINFVTGNGDVSLQLSGGASGVISGSSTSTGSFGAGFFGGRLGIGTTSPGHRFEVEHSDDTVAQFKSTDNNGQIIVADDDTTAYFGANGSRAFMGTASGLAGNTNLVVNSSGQVGIGTVSPNKQLHVHEPSAGSSHAAFTNTDTGLTTEFLVGISSGEIAELWNENNTPMRFATNDTERIRIDNSGNVGIGTTTPDYKLDVEGDIRATGNVYAENYIVSSSVTSMSFAQNSGSTIFGDTQDDIHQFTGSVNVTGSMMISSLNQLHLLVL